MNPSYQQLCSWENLWLAWRKASKGKRGKCSAASFEYRLEDNLFILQSELIEKRYQAEGYSSFYIHEPKRRLISEAPFRDRVVHHALCQIIEPLFERSFIHDSYANRIGKGTHRALDRTQHFAQHYKFVLQCDIEQFFPAIDHEILRQILMQKIDDQGILWLIDRILENGECVLSEEYTIRIFPGDDFFELLRPRGLPIGNLTSQFWANCYLNPFDHFIKRELGCKAYLRYVDDFLLFSNDKKVLWQWKQAIIERLQHFRLTIHNRTAQVRSVSEGIPFLGFIIFPTHRRLKPRKGHFYRRRLKKLISAYHKGEIPLDQLKASIQGWINHVRYGDTWGLRRAIFNSFPIPSPKKNYERRNGHLHKDL